MDLSAQKAGPASRSLAKALASALTLCVAAFLACVPADFAKSAELGRRVAMVVGVSHYEHAGTLANTLNDAADITIVLKRVGFEVETVVDPTRASLEAAIRRFGQRSVGADASLFYYSGHALESGGRNWILPTNVNLNTERDLPFEAVNLATVLEQTDGAARASFVFLDACRENPFALRLTASRRDLPSRGLAPVESGTTGVLIAFSTSPGQVAYDGTGRNSPFTGALLKLLETPGLEIKALMGRVAEEVAKATDGKQRPWQSSSLGGDFYFVPRPASSAAVGTGSDANLEALFWDSIKDSREPSDFRAYLAKFPQGIFAPLARNRLGALDRPNPAAPTMTASSPKADKPNAPTPSSTNAGADFKRLALARLATFGIADQVAAKEFDTYAARQGHKALAGTKGGSWRASSRQTRQGAIESALEACQIYNKVPCSLIAVDDVVVAPSDALASPQDMPRTRYAGAFEAQMIPTIDAPARTHEDVLAYRSTIGPKAIALHPWGRVFVAFDKDSQKTAEETALSRCNADPDRKGQNGSCLLYAVGDRVILPQRMTTARATPKTVSEGFEYVGTPQVAANYAKDTGHKAVALALESGLTFRFSRAATAEKAETSALEACQLQNHAHCILVASDDQLMAPEPWSAPRRDMPNVRQRGVYWPDHLPYGLASDRKGTEYASMATPKAMAIRPSGGRLEIARGATPREAQARALAACNSDYDAFPCFVFAVDNNVIIDQRLTEPAP